MWSEILVLGSSLVLLCFFTSIFVKPPGNVTMNGFQSTAFKQGKEEKKSYSFAVPLGVQLYLLTMLLLISEVWSFAVALPYLCGSGNLLCAIICIYCHTQWCYTTAIMIAWSQLKINTSHKTKNSIEKCRQGSVLWCICVCVTSSCFSYTSRGFLQTSPSSSVLTLSLLLNIRCWNMK